MGGYGKALIVACALVLIWPDAAQAADLRCTNGVPSGGGIFSGSAACDSFGVSQPFSTLNCYFQQNLNLVISRSYCGIQYNLAPVLNVAIVLFVMLYGIMFSFGLAALTAKELVVRLIKIALIWTFAMNAEWGVGMALFFLFGGIEEIVTWIMRIFPDMNAPDGLRFIEHLDYLIFQQLIGGFTIKGALLFGMFGILATLVFPVFLLFVVYMMTVMAALMRTVITYLVGLSAIGFLIALGPIFVSLALFKTTYTFFDSWLRYLISFALQVILVFAATALWLYVMFNFGGHFFQELMSILIPFGDRAESQGTFAFFKDTHAICPMIGNDLIWDRTVPLTLDQIQQRPSGIVYLDDGEWTGRCRGGLDPWLPEKYASNGDFLAWLTENLITLGALVYAFDALLKMTPNFARQLAGPAFAPQLGGGTGFGSVQMPGFSAIGRAKERLMYQAKSGIYTAIARMQRQTDRGVRDQIGGMPGSR